MDFFYVLIIQKRRTFHLLKLCSSLIATDFFLRLINRMSIQINFVKRSNMIDMLNIKNWTRGYLINSFTGLCIVIQVALRFVIIAHCKRAESLQQTRIFHESMREAGQDNSLDLWPLWSSHNLRVQQPHYRIIRYDWHNAYFISCLLSPFLRRYFIAYYSR